jgi:hypothetical protein
MMNESVFKRAAVVANNIKNLECILKELRAVHASELCGFIFVRNGNSSDNEKIYYHLSGNHREIIYNLLKEDIEGDLAEEKALFSQL